jgi:hypothetical protein
MSELTREDAHEIWLTAERIKRVSDKLVSAGPIGIGLDGLLAPVPLAGTLFSLAAGAWLVFIGFKAKASNYTLARMILYVGFRTVASVVPLEGWLVDIFFRGHLLAANALQKDIQRRYGKPEKDAVADARKQPFWWTAAVPAIATRFAKLRTA